MKNQLSSEAATALSPLTSCFRELDGCRLQTVWEEIVYGEVESIQLDFGSRLLRIGVDVDDDSIQIELVNERTPHANDASHLQPWIEEIGKPFGWGWISINQQGYLDSVSFAFGAVTPKLTVTAVASSLRITRNSNIRRREDRRPNEVKGEATHQLDQTDFPLGTSLHQ